MEEKKNKQIKEEKAKGGVRKMERLREKRGITLIALVVTIVVLLILAGITISLVFSENGVVTKAKEAKEETRGAAVEEARDMWELDKSLTEYVGGSSQSLDELLDSLESQKQITAEEKAQIKETGSVTIGSRTITFNTARTLVELYDAGELKIGDYVNYQNPTSGSYTSLGSKTGMEDLITDGGDSDQIFNVANNQLTWRVLGKDEATGGIKLIAGSPMKRESNSSYDDLIGITKDPYYYLNGAKGYINAETELNNICALYKNDLAQTARSVTIEDINQVLGIKTEEDIKKANVFPMMVGSLQYGETYNFENQYTPESWLDGKKTTTVTGTVDGYAFIINPPSEMGITSVTLEDEKIYNLLFYNAKYGNFMPKHYWLASYGVCTDAGGYAYFKLGFVEGGIAGTGCDMFFSSGDDYGIRRSICSAPRSHSKI